ncbi:hypothetical protein ACET3Z_001566 [Daucus carota]
MNRKDLVSWTSMMIGYGKEAAGFDKELELRKHSSAVLAIPRKDPTLLNLLQQLQQCSSVLNSHKFPCGSIGRSPMLVMDYLSLGAQVSWTIRLHHFGKGALVEVTSNENGSQELFRAMANMKHIRPYSPETATIDYYSLLQEVDALCDDNWWWCSFQKYFKSSLTGEVGNHFHIHEVYG